jgi:hypothetical protein
MPRINLPPINIMAGKIIYPLVEQIDENSIPLINMYLTGQKGAPF